MAKLDELIRGAFDLHCHVYPEVSLEQEARHDDVGLVQGVEDAGMAGLVLKSHLWPTVERAYYLQRQFPNDTNVKLLAIESLLRDKHDPRAALTALSPFPVRADDRRLQMRVGFLKADAYVAAGKSDSARAVLEQLANAFPDLKQRITERERMINDH